MAAFTPARLQAVKELPVGEGWLYEPKFDGYRGLLMSSPSGKGSIWSRNNRDLSRWFPELVVLASRLPRGTVLDGEIVMPTDRGVSFIALQRRLASFDRESPAAFIAFDTLSCRDEDLRSERLSLRRTRLESTVDDMAESSLQLMTQTGDISAAAAWLDDSLTIAGIEGVVAKLDEPYPKPDAKRWRKVRRITTMEFAVRGFIPEGDSMRLVLATASADSHLVGTTYPISGRDAKPLEHLVSQAIPAEHRVWAPFEDGRRDWYELPLRGGLIAEVMVTAVDSGVLRQPARFLRWRFAEPVRSLLPRDSGATAK
jgi:ATP-dependent DNA ligase